MKVRVKFLPSQKETELASKRTVLDAAIKLHLPINSDCGGKGLCGKCKIRIEKGDLGIDSVEEKFLTEGEKKSRVRLACRRVLKRNTVVRLKKERAFPLSEIPEAVEKRDIRSEYLGLCFDIGTTTLSGYLVDLKSGTTLKALSALNSQRAHGADIISRIHFASNPKGLKRLQGLIIEDVENMIDKLVRKKENIHSSVFVGNTAMHHLFLGIDPKSLGTAPYRPAVKKGMEFELRDLGIGLEKGVKGYFLPNIAGFVGSDALAAILFTGIYQKEDLSLIIDIGTNGEIILGNRRRILAASNAAGPAFEGAGIRYGMKAEKGAIDRYEINKHGIKFHVLGDVAPRGICGSGIIDAVACLVRIGLIAPMGNLLKREEVSKKIPKKIKERIFLKKEGISFQLTKREESYNKRALYLFQRDIREIQLAKGAIAASIKLLIKEFGKGVDDISNIYLTGSFGNVIDPRSAIDIGLIPRVSLKKIKFLGNAAGLGAKLVLLSKGMKETAKGLARRIEHVGFAGTRDYQEAFIESMNLSKGLF